MNTLYLIEKIKPSKHITISKNFLQIWYFSSIKFGHEILIWQICSKISLLKRFWKSLTLLVPILLEQNFLKGVFEKFQFKVATSFQTLKIKSIISLYILSWLRLEVTSFFSKVIEIGRAWRNLQNSLVKVHLSDIFVGGTQ